MILNWRQYYLRKWVFILGFLTAFPLVVLVNNYFGMKCSVPFFVVWEILVVFRQGYLYVETPCPNCKWPVHSLGFFSYPMGPKCLHCGIKIGKKIPE